MRAAAQQFSRAEYSEVEMKAIAAEAGLTPAAIYNHFASKDELFIATANHMTRVNLKVIEEAVSASADWRAMLAGVLQLFRDDPSGWFGYPLMITAVQLKMLQNRERFVEMLELRRAYARQFERIVDAAKASGELPEALPQPLAAQLLMGFVFNGMGTVRSHYESEEAIGAIVETTAILLGATGRARAE